MRLPWQCPTCYAELGDKSYAKMLTCPYCGSLLIVNGKNKKFFRVPRGRGWYYFSKIPMPGYIKFGEYEEAYVYKEEKWFLVRDDGVYEMQGIAHEFEGKMVEVGKVKYIWGEIPFVAPPESVVKTAKNGYILAKIAPRETLLFIKSEEKFPDISVKLLQGTHV